MPQATAAESTLSFEWAWPGGGESGRRTARVHSPPPAEAPGSMSFEWAWLGGKGKSAGKLARQSHSPPPLEGPGTTSFEWAWRGGRKGGGWAGSSRPRPCVRARRPTRSWAAEEGSPPVGGADHPHSDARTWRLIHFSVSEGAVRSVAGGDPPLSDVRTWRPILHHRACFGNNILVYYFNTCSLCPPASPMNKMWHGLITCRPLFRVFFLRSVPTQRELRSRDFPFTIQDVDKILKLPFFSFSLSLHARQGCNR